MKAHTKVSCGMEWNSGLDLVVLLRAGPLRARLAKPMNTSTYVVNCVGDFSYDEYELRIPTRKSFLSLAGPAC
jgi:hypothetical protein